MRLRRGRRWLVVVVLTAATLGCAGREVDSDAVVDLDQLGPVSSSSLADCIPERDLCGRTYLVEADLEAPIDDLLRDQGFQLTGDRLDGYFGCHRERPDRCVSAFWASERWQVDVTEPYEIP